MQKMTAFLWFDGDTEKAVNFYTSFSQNSKTGRVAGYFEASAKIAGRSKMTRFHFILFKLSNPCV